MRSSAYRRTCWRATAGQAEANRDAGSDLDESLRVLVDACHTLAREFQPFLPAASERIERAIAASDPKLGRQLFPKPL